MIELFDNNEACKIAGEASGEMHRIYGLGAKNIPVDDTMDFTFTFGTMDGLKEAIDNYYTEGHNGFVLKYPYRGESKYAVLLSLAEPTIAYKRPFEMKIKVRVTSPDFACDYMTLDENGEYEYMGLYTEFGYKPTNVFVPPVIFNDTMQPIMTNQLESMDEALLFGGNFLDLTSDEVKIDVVAGGDVLYYDMDTKEFWGADLQEEDPAIRLNLTHGGRIPITGVKANTLLSFDLPITAPIKDKMTANPYLIYDVFFNDASIADVNEDILITKSNIVHFYPCQENSGELIYDLVNQPLAMDFSIELNNDTGVNVTLPLVSGNTFLFEVDWGDGTIENYIGDGSTPPTHSYVTAGVKRITIKGQCEYVKFYGSSLQDSLIEVHSLGDTATTIYADTYKNCVNLIYVGAGDVSNVSYFSGMFSGSGLLAQDGTNTWNTKNLTRCQYMYYNVQLSTPPHTSGWDTSKLEYAYSMVEGVSCLLDDMGIESWDISSLLNVTDFAKGSGGFSTTVADQIILNWDAQAHQLNVPFHMGETTYLTDGGAVKEAYNRLEDDGWTITIGGFI